VTSAELTWTAPGPGTWRNDRAYKRTTYTMPMQRTMARVFKEGFGSWTLRYGIPLSHLDLRFVNGYPFAKPVIAGVPDRSGPPPPAPLLKILVRLSPPLRKRAKAAKRALAERPWREERRRWIDHEAAAQTAANLAIQD